jgi:hypothetical protein
MRLTLTLLGLTGLLLTTSCKKGLDKEQLVDVDKEFTIEMWDKLGDNGGNLQLNLATLKNQDCAGVRIGNSARLVGNSFVVTLMSLDAPPTCTAIKEPARDTIQVPTLGKYGRFPFQLNLKDAVINKGFLTIDATKMAISMEQENGILLPIKEVFRVPQNTMWGFIGYDNGQEAKATEMMERLKTAGTELNFANGNYGYYQVNNGAVTLHSSMKTTKLNLRPFLMRLNSKEALYDVTAYIRANSNLDFKILTADGRIFAK